MSISNLGRYKAKELEFRRKLFPNHDDLRAITASDVLRATARIVGSPKSPLSTDDLNILQDVIKQREAAIHSYGDGCEGHLYWLEVLRSALADLRTHRTTTMQQNVEAARRNTPTPNEDTDGPEKSGLAALQKILKRFDLEEGRRDASDLSSGPHQQFQSSHLIAPSAPSPMGVVHTVEGPSLQSTVEEVCILMGLVNMKLLGEWLANLWHELKAGRVDFATAGLLSNCVQQLVYRQYVELDLLYNWGQHRIFHQHPLILAMESAIKRRFGPTDGSVSGNLAFSSPVLSHVHDQKTANSRQLLLNQWLLAITQDVWFEAESEDCQYLSSIRVCPLLFALRVHHKRLEAQTPYDHTDLPSAKDWLRQVELSLDGLEDTGLPPIWGLCHFMARIVGERHRIDRLCVQTRAFARIIHTFIYPSDDAVAVRTWLLDRYGARLYPTGLPTTLLAATGSINGPSSKLGPRYMKIISQPSIVEILLESGNGFNKAVAQLRAGRQSWGGIQDDCELLGRIKPLIINESNRMFHLDAPGWVVVSPPLRWDSPDYATSACRVADLEVSEARLQQTIPSNSFETALPDIALSMSDEVTALSAASNSLANSQVKSTGFIVPGDIMCMAFYPGTLAEKVRLTLRNSVWLTVNVEEIIQLSVSR